MSTFGDWDVDDAVDHEPADPEQVARRLYRLRTEVDALAGIVDPAFDQLGAGPLGAVLAAGAELVADLVDTVEPHALARAVHQAGRARSGLADWDQLDDDTRRLAVDLVDLIVEWLRREGALP